jgi:hypothetical protein
LGCVFKEPFEGLPPDAETQVGCVVNNSVILLIRTHSNRITGISFIVKITEPVSEE